MIAIQESVRRVAVLLTIALTMLATECFAQSGIGSKPYLSNVIAELQKQWPQNRSINLVFHGHSVPAGYFKTPVVNTFDSYPYLLQRALKERYPYAVINVIVTAIGGENSIKGAERFELDVLRHHPDVVFIDYGLNDRSIGLPAARAAWASMIEKAQKRGVKVILLTPTADSTGNIADPSDPICLHAEQIRGLSKQFGLGLADSLKAFQKYVAGNGRLDDLLAQSNHPNRRGHELVVGEILSYFAAN
jgi:lysophospholipase L1-like esterase